jgi:hypothetical protein
MVGKPSANDGAGYSQNRKGIWQMAKGTITRSTISGQFVKPSAAVRSPSTTVTEKIGGGSTNGVHRSAATGLFVKQSYADRNPRTTMKDN